MSVRSTIFTPGPGDDRHAPTLIREGSSGRAEARTIALFPDGTRIAVYDDGRVKVGREGHRVAVGRRFGFRPAEFVWLAFVGAADA